MNEISQPKKRKKRKHVGFVLQGSFDYEGGIPLGVYSTRKRAEKARDSDKGNYDSGNYDSYDIFRFEVNALP